jgi:diacylglycerol kinase family enzyme
MKHLAVVYNPKSGSSNVSAKQLTELFSNYKVKIDYYSISKDLELLSTNLKTNKYTCLVAVGGDGTVNLCANYATQFNVTLGVLPAGTLNHFAKDALIPQDLHAAAQVIIEGKTKNIDYATVEDKVFVNNASIGIYPIIVIKRQQLQTKIGKWPAAFVVTFTSLFSNNSKRISVETPNGVYKHKTSMLFVGNNSYHFDKIGFNNRSKLNSGKLFLYIVHDNHPLALVSSALLAFFGIRRKQMDTLLNTEGPISVHSRKVTLEVTVDGEVLILKSPINFCTHPEGMRLMVPRET